MPADLKARADVEGEASLRGHLKAEGAEEAGSQSYVPPEEKDDRTLKEALDLLPGTITDAAFPPNPKATVRSREGRKGAAEATLIINEVVKSSAGKPLPGQI